MRHRLAARATTHPEADDQSAKEIKGHPVVVHEAARPVDQVTMMLSLQVGDRDGECIVATSKLTHRQPKR